MLALLCSVLIACVIHTVLRPSLQVSLTLLFHHRWLEVQVANLTCPQRWVQYLRLLQESIWPGGVLPKYPRPVRTQEQKVAAEEQALQSLMGVLPGNSMRLIIPISVPSQPALPSLPHTLPHF